MANNTGYNAMDSTYRSKLLSLHLNSSRCQYSACLWAYFGRAIPSHIESVVKESQDWVPHNAFFQPNIDKLYPVNHSGIYRREKGENFLNETKN